MAKLISQVWTLCREFNSRKNIGLFFNQVAALPPSLQLVSMPVKRVPPEEAQLLRSQFKKSKRNDFYLLLAEKHGDALLRMGISLNEIDRMMERGYRPRHLTGLPLDITIDHIQALKFGGANELENYCLLPGLYNHMKDYLEEMQMERDPKLSEIITIVPQMIDGQYDRVPFIPGGYQIRHTGSNAPSIPEQ